MKKYRYLYYFFQVLNMATSICIPIAIKRIIDALSVSSREDFIYWVISDVIIIVIFILSLSMSYYFMTWYEEEKIKSYRIAIYDYLKDEDVAELNAKSLGFILTRFNEDIEEIRPFILEIPFKRITKGIYLISVMTIMFYYDILLASAIVILFPIFYLIQNKMSIKLKGINKDIKEIDEKLNNNLEEFYNYNYTIKANDVAEIFKEKNEKSLKYYSDRVIDRMKVDVKYDFIFSTGLLNLFDVVIYILGGILILTGRMTLGSLTLFSYYVSKLWSPIEFYMSYPKEKSLYGMHKERLDEILSSTHQFTVSYGDQEDFEALELKNINIVYKEPIFEDLNFKIEKKEKVGISGKNGSGKTTLSNLLSGILKNYTGEILLNGEIIDQRSNSLNSIVRLIPDEPDIFYGTVKENITLFREKEIGKAQKILDLLRWNNIFPDTVIGGSLNNLSGGERKLIQIARGIVSNGEVFIFDEPLNFIDKENVEMLIETISELYKDKTLIIISHDDRVKRLIDRDYIISEKKLYLEERRI